MPLPALTRAEWAQHETTAEVTKFPCGVRGHLPPSPVAPGTSLLGTGLSHTPGEQGIFTLEDAIVVQPELSLEVKHKQVHSSEVTPLTGLSGFHCKMNFFQQNLF